MNCGKSLLKTSSSRISAASPSLLVLAGLRSLAVTNTPLTCEISSHNRSLVTVRPSPSSTQRWRTACHNYEEQYKWASKKSVVRACDCHFFAPVTCSFKDSLFHYILGACVCVWGVRGGTLTFKSQLRC